MKFLVLTIALMFFTSCKNKASLQEYFVKKSENPDFTSFNFSPKHYLKEKGLKLSENNVLEQIKNVNILLLNKEDSVMLKTEYAHLKTILENEMYQDLVRFTSKGMKIQVDYVGTDNKIDEVVVLANKEGSNLAVLRILTDGVRIEQLMDIVNTMQNDTLSENSLDTILKGYLEK